MSVEGHVREKLMIGLRPTRLDVINELELHAGHRSSPDTGNSHFRVLIISDAFTGKSRVERHRLVNELLKDELAGGIHALALSTLAPGEPVPQSLVYKRLRDQPPSMAFDSASPPSRSAVFGTGFMRMAVILFRLLRKISKR